MKTKLALLALVTTLITVPAIASSGSEKESVCNPVENSQQEVQKQDEVQQKKLNDRSWVVRSRGTL